MTKQCEACGGLVSRAAPACPHCGHPQTQMPPDPIPSPLAAPPPVPKKNGGFALGYLVIVGVLGAVAVSMASRKQEPEFTPERLVVTQVLPAPYVQPAAPMPAAPAYVAPPPPPPRITDAERLTTSSPASQRSFLQVVINSRQAFNNAPNDMQKGATRPARAQSLCAGLPSGLFENWAGKITRLSSNNEGRGVLAIEIGTDVELKTWNNSVSDAGDNTLIAPTSALFNSVSAMRVGQLVRVSGMLVRERTDCFKEGSMTVSGAMTEPEFIVRFSRVEPL
jgi:hypothetical protein